MLSLAPRSLPTCAPSCSALRDSRCISSSGSASLCSAVLSRSCSMMRARALASFRCELVARVGVQLTRGVPSTISVHLPEEELALLCPASRSAMPSGRAGDANARSVGICGGACKRWGWRAGCVLRADVFSPPLLTLSSYKLTT